MKPLKVSYHEFRSNKPEHCIAPHYKYYWMAEVNGYYVYITQDYQSWCRGENVYRGSVVKGGEFEYGLCQWLIQSAAPLKAILKSVVEVISNKDERLVSPSGMNYYVRTGNKELDEKEISNIYKAKLRDIEKRRKEALSVLESIDEEKASLDLLYEGYTNVGQK